jgi:hypothetical protein
MKTPENVIKDKIREWLVGHGAYVFSPVQMGFGVRTLDLVVCYKGCFLAIEVKRPGKKPTAMQVRIMERVQDAGGIAWWFDDFRREWWDREFDRQVMARARMKELV